MSATDRSPLRQAAAFVTAVVLAIGPAAPVAVLFVEHVAEPLFDLDRPIEAWSGADWVLGPLLLVGMLAAMCLAVVLGTFLWIPVAGSFLSRAEVERWIFFGPRFDPLDRLYTRALDRRFGPRTGGPPS